MVFGSIVPQLEMLSVLEPAASWEGTPGTAERARPDGYTILMGHAGTHAFSVSFYPNLAYKPDVDFEPIGAVLEIPILIVARKDLPPRDLKEFIAYVKGNAGKLNVGHSGVMPRPVMMMSARAVSADAKMSPVPIEGGTSTVTVNVSGSVQMK